MERLLLLLALAVGLAWGCDPDAPSGDAPTQQGDAGDEPIDTEGGPTPLPRDGGPIPGTDGGPTGDVTAPTWADGAELTLEVGVTRVIVRWPAAQDDIGVVGYRVYIGEGLVGEVDGLELTVDELAPGAPHRITVEAGDAADNWSQDGPSANVRTARDFDPGFRRLTEVQFNRTLADLYGPFWQAGCARHGGDGGMCNWPRDAEGWHTIITTQNYGYWRAYQRGYPDDAPTAAVGEPRGGYGRLDQTVYGEHLSHWIGAAMGIASGAYEGWVGWRLVFDPCERDNRAGVTNFGTREEVFENCISEVITDFGDRAFRRPLTAEEHAEFMEVFREVGAVYPDEGLDTMGLARRGLRNVLAVITSSPEFVYRVEVGDEQGDLTAYELASRLSYHFWNTMPDAALFAAAADGSLMTDPGYRAQVQRLVDDPRAEKVIDEFYRAFFRVENIPDLRHQEGPATYHAGPDYNVYGNALGHNVEAMQAELANLGLWYTNTAPGTYEEMFRSNLHFLECYNPSWDAEECYGAGPFSQWAYGIGGQCGPDDEGACTTGGWDGVSPPVELPEAERAGLVTRLALLAHDTIGARPIRRGLYIREALLCELLPPPENCDVVKPPEIDINMTVREKVEAITEQPDTSCVGCHGALINGYGHALGHFSSKGQHWQTEPMFTDDMDRNGDYRYRRADPDTWPDIDAQGTTFFDGEMVTIDGAHELADLLAGSGKLEACWAREYFRFAIGRTEWTEDTETIDAMAARLVAGDTLADAFAAIAHTAQFKTLYHPAQNPGAQQ